MTGPVRRGRLASGPRFPGVILDGSQPRKSSDVAAGAFADILGDDASLLAATRTLARFAPTSLPVLLLAETGTGKELFARAVHGASPRSRGPFVPLNCGALSPGLLESEMFGHAPGAFTGAQRNGSAGKLAAADGGTLFLDEIAEMPETLQATLLRVLEDGSYYRVGESRPRRSDFRLVCATCRDLPALVGAGRFRRDLFFRIQGAAITIPPLRERTDKVPLARGLLTQLAAETGALAPALSPDAIEWIESHSFPGNVRELKTALAHALVMSDGAPVLSASCFPRVILRDVAPPREVADATTSPSHAEVPLSGRRRSDVLQEMMIATLRACDGNVSEAARRLGVARSTLYRHMGHRAKSA